MDDGRAGSSTKLTAADLPAPYATESVSNQPKIVPRPEGAMPQVPAGFRVEQFADDLKKPRVIRTAPNGDLFVAEANANRIRVLRDADGDGKPEVNEVFAEGLNRPFGIAFYPLGPEPQVCLRRQHRLGGPLPLQERRHEGRGRAETIVKIIPSGKRGSAAAGTGRGTWSSRPTARRCTSRSARARTSTTTKPEARRARILAFDPDGKNERVFASGIRNPGRPGHASRRRASSGPR